MESELDFYRNALTLTGAILGIVAFFWKFWDFLWINIFSHLQLSLDVTQVSSTLLKITTEIENKGNAAKKINYAFILISPEHVNLKDALERALNEEKHINGAVTTSILLNAVVKEKYNCKLATDQNYFILPLKYYHQEQIHVGNEKLKHSISLSLDLLEGNKIYTIRFIIVSLHLMNTYLRYRSTSEILFNIK